MRTSLFPLSTLKETPTEAEIISHQLMLRAGMIRRLASGLYTWTPLGLRVLRKVEAVVREEMDAIGALELLMPAIQPAELWQESGRWQKYGPELLRVKDRHSREFCVGPTHEEVITDYTRRELKSYRQLPLCYYQVQTKFRDEIRPRFGVMRAREFIMKDAYSFHADVESLKATYQAMFDAYCRIFTRLGLKFRAVEADTGSIGGNGSHEFHVLADSGEDAIAYATHGDYAANVEMAPTYAASQPRPAPSAPMTRIATPEAKTIEEVAHFLNLPAHRVLKTLLVRGRATPAVAVVLRGDHELNDIKAAKHPLIADPFELIPPVEALALTGANVGSIGPMGLNIPVIVDFAAADCADFVCGANEEGWHLTQVNWDRDVPLGETADLRNAIAGDPAPNGMGTLAIARGIEVGHVFQLGTTYSAALHCEFLDEQGKPATAIMGCYGIGVSRIVAAAIEQNHDANGIVWPVPLAPFAIAIVPINGHRAPAVQAEAERLEAELTRLGFSVLLDDRGLRPGVAFADMELIGIPLRIVISERGLAAGEYETRLRWESENQNIAASNLLAWVQSQLVE
ncbi:MAG: proline--tRNA ligase [Halothiobacillaceae bacterium]|nr:proline--tRNA ligase [Halothiobacillaceae bacterium]HUM99896.1 proline--tRNA ligase [Halothiobacillus sp.]